jgi:hypothetical protein
MMKIFISAFALTLLVTPASAYTCEDVRQFVAENGLAQARAKARAAGMTDAQERQAARCLGIRIGNVRHAQAAVRCGPNGCYHYYAHRSQWPVGQGGGYYASTQYNGQYRHRSQWPVGQ